MLSAAAWAGEGWKELVALLLQLLVKVVLKVVLGWGVIVKTSLLPYLAVSIGAPPRRRSARR